VLTPSPSSIIKSELRGYIEGPFYLDAMGKGPGTIGPCRESPYALIVVIVIVLQKDPEDILGTISIS
jgi:hypothetical protein